jgi:hypothetical protein
MHHRLGLEPGYTLFFDRGCFHGRFAEWQLVSASPDTDGEISGPLRNVPRTWYRLVRR